MLDQLRGKEQQTRFLLNKADLVEASEVTRVTGQLLWNVSPLLGSSDAPTIYTVSMINRFVTNWFHKIGPHFIWSFHKFYKRRGRRKSGARFFFNSSDHLQLFPTNVDRTCLEVLRSTWRTRKKSSWLISKKWVEKYRSSVTTQKYIALSIYTYIHIYVQTFHILAALTFQVMDERVENTIMYARRHAVRVRNHAKLVDCYLDAFYKHKVFWSWLYSSGIG